MAEKTPTHAAATCVCRSCNGNIISKNHPLDLFGEKEIKEGIGGDLEIFSLVKISLDAGFPSRNMQNLLLKSHQISGTCEDGSLFKSPTGVDYSIQKREDCTRKPVVHHLTRCGT